MARSIFLAGFMGVGKSAVGRALAARTGRELRDMDAAIEERLGASIATIFRERGEAAFREEEARLCAEWAGEPDLVVALGGGAAASAMNRAAIEAGAELVCLSAGPEVIERRLAAVEDRPLLPAEGVERGQRLRRLMASRAPDYASVFCQVDSGRCGPEAAAAEVLSSLEAARALPEHDRIVFADARQAYPILIGEGLGAALGSALRARGLVEPGRRVLVVSDASVATLHGEGVRRALESAGLEVHAVAFPAGEAAKTLATIAALYDACAAAGIDRSSLILGLGGGVACDLAGFVAATWMRGLGIVQLPTSLLAMVDASVGGKTGFDRPEGKNLVGAFKQPAMVIVDPTFLATLPEDERRAGLAEAIKHGILADPALFELFEREPEASPASWLTAAIEVKRGVASRDPEERGERMLLNLGHTFAHAIEKVSGFTIPHGFAVSAGLVAAAAMARELGRAPAALVARIRSVLAGAGLPVRFAQLDPTAVLAAMAQDKKRRGRALRFIIPLRLGAAAIIEAPPGAAVERAIASAVGPEEA